MTRNDRTEMIAAEMVAVILNLGLDTGTNMPLLNSEIENVIRNMSDKVFYTLSDSQIKTFIICHFENKAALRNY